MLDKLGSPDIHDDWGLGNISRLNIHAAPSAKILSVLNAEEIIVSDFHLLNGSSQASYLLEFLLHSKSKRLILAGDVFDFWEAAKKKTWKPNEIERRIVEVILQKARDGTHVVLIPGNHEQKELRRPAILGRSFLGVSVAPKIVEGDRVITHGDEFDPFVVKWGETVHAVGASLKIFIPAYHAFRRSYNALRKAISKNEFLVGLGRFLPSLDKTPSLSRTIQGEAQREDIDRKETQVLHHVQQRALDYMKQHGIRELRFGHTHVPNEVDIKDKSGKTIHRIVDSGDWIENKTYIKDGHLFDWGEERIKLGLSGPPSHEPYIFDKKTARDTQKLFTALYRLCPGTARSGKLKQLGQYIHEAEDRRDRAALYRDFASAVEKAQKIGDLPQKLGMEFKRLSEKCKDIQKRIHGADVVNPKDEAKLRWHTEIKEAVAQTLGGNLDGAADKLKDSFIKKAERLELRADQSVERAAKIRGNLAKSRTSAPTLSKIDFLPETLDI